MRNLCYFCHYGRGNVKEKTIKIGGSALMAIMLFLLMGSAQWSTAAEQTSGVLSGLIPEPGYLIASEIAQNQEPAMQAAPEPAPQSPTPSEPPPLQPAPHLEGDLQMPPAPAEENGDHEQVERQNLERWKQDRLREWRDQLREIAKVHRQLLRLKGSQDELAKLDAMKESIVGCQSRLGSATEPEGMKDVLEGEECGDTGDLWEEINRIRQAVELPRELNQLMLQIKRLERTAVQKWAKKMVDLTAVVSAIKERHAEAKAAYQAGEYEEAMEIIRENFHEKGGPGECQGALFMLRGFVESLRRIKDPELKSELQELIDPVKEALASGECREAREAAEAIQRELGPQIFKLIFDNERRRKALPNDLFDRIERVRQKLGEVEGPAEGVPGVPSAAPAEVEVKPIQ